MSHILNFANAKDKVELIRKKRYNPPFDLGGDLLFSIGDLLLVEAGVGDECFMVGRFLNFLLEWNYIFCLCIRIRL